MPLGSSLIRAISISMLTLCFTAILLVSGVQSFCPTNSQNSSSRPSCYYYLDLPKTFADATVFCQSFGAQLASITNAFEANQVRENSQAQGAGKNAAFWLGANDVGQNGQYSWLDGTPFSYARWGNSQPDLSKQCLSMHTTDGKWYSADCSSALGFSCMSPNKNLVPSCESGWTWFQSSSSCYKVIHNVTSMQNAEALCQSVHSHLTSIHGDTENKFVNEISMAGETLPAVQMVYIGMKRNQNGNFEWTDGSAVDYYNWAEGEPNDENGEELCVETYADKDTEQYVEGNYVQKWNDCLCDIEMRAAVCKKPAGN